ncbi:MAG: hypothetical protein ABR607_01195 [Pyrinomonadaceae bacterium]
MQHDTARGCFFGVYADTWFNCHGLQNTEMGEMVVRERSLISIAFQLLFAASIVSAQINVRAQTPAPSPQAASTQTVAAVPTANHADVATMDAIVASLYDVISGPPGARNWDRFRSLFVPGARLIPTGARPTGEVASRVLTPDEYVQRSAPRLEKDGFFEREVSRRLEKFGNIAHIFSTYESRHKADDSKPFARGINSIQLMNDGKRWWVVTVFWQGEDDKNPLPAEYLRTRS